MPTESKPQTAEVDGLTGCADDQSELGAAIGRVIASGNDLVIRHALTIMRLTTALRTIASSAGAHGERGTSGDGHARCIELAKEALSNG